MSSEASHVARVVVEWSESLNRPLAVSMPKEEKEIKIGRETERERMGETGREREELMRVTTGNF